MFPNKILCCYFKKGLNHAAMILYIGHSFFEAILHVLWIFFQTSIMEVFYVKIKTIIFAADVG
jgi:hypothetical protein